MATRLEATRSPLENILMDLELWNEENEEIYEGVRRCVLVRRR